MRSSGMSTPLTTPARIPRLSYFFPAHDEEANLEGLVAEALATLPGLADTFEIIVVDDGSRDALPDLADALAAALPDIVRLRRGALRAGRLYRRRSPVQGRGRRPAVRPDRRGGPPRRRRRLPDQARRSPGPNPVRPGVPPGQPRLLRPEDHRRRLRLQALPTRGARGALGRIRGRVLLGRDDHQTARRRPHRRGGGRPPLPADGRFGHRCQAPGRPARGPRLLAASIADVGEPRARAAPRGADGPDPAVAPSRGHTSLRTRASRFRGISG